MWQYVGDTDITDTVRKIKLMLCNDGAWCVVRGGGDDRRFQILGFI